MTQTTSTTSGPGRTGSLAGRPAFSGFSSNDIAAALSFYRDTLGLAANEEEGMVILRFPSGQRVLIYPKEDHQPATFTVLNIEVEDIEPAVDALVSAGVRFERYGPEFEQDERGIARVSGESPIAWFRDPAGNILSVIETANDGP